MSKRVSDLRWWCFLFEAGLAVDTRADDHLGKRQTVLLASAGSLASATACAAHINRMTVCVLCKSGHEQNECMHVTLTGSLSDLSAVLGLFNLTQRPTHTSTLPN